MRSLAAVSRSRSGREPRSMTRRHLGHWDSDPSRFPHQEHVLMCRLEDRLAMSWSATQIGLAFSTRATDAGSVQRRDGRAAIKP